jgi:hypothetical protein
MAFSFENPEANGLPTGENVTLEELDEIARRCAALPVLDPRPTEELIEYDDYGVPR